MEMTAMAEAVRWIEASFEAFAQTAGPVFVATLWQGAVIAGGLALCLRLTPRVSAADRFRAWAAGFAAVAALPFLPSLLAVLRGGAGLAAAPGIAGGEAARAWFDLDPRWTLAIAAVWILVALYRVADLAVHSWRLRRLWKGARPVDPPSLALPGSQRRGTWGTHFSWPGVRVEVCTTRELDRPSVIGFFRPRILIPEWLLEKLTPAELEQVVLHEAEHLRRRDDWTNLAQKLALAVFPLNPALAWMERRMCREREMACDEAVVRATEKPRSYAACLASLAERGLERDLAARRGPAEALSLGAWRRRPELAERVHRILRLGPGLPPATARALLGLVGCGLLFGSIELAQSPQVVAFAKQEQPEAAAVEMAPAAMVRTGLATERTNGFRPMNAMVRVPETVEGRASKARRSPALAPEKHRGSTMHRSAARATELRAAAGADAQEAAPTQDAVPRQWVVFAAWEQVETTGAPAGAVASATVARPAVAGRVAVTRQITMTRLVVIYPAEAGRVRAGAAGSETGLPTTGSAKAGSLRPFVTGLPAAIPLRDGWLVFQL